MLRAGHWDDPEEWDGKGGRRGVQDGEHMYTHGWFLFCKIIQSLWKIDWQFLTCTKLNIILP